MDLLTLILDIFGGGFLLGIGLWIGYFNDIYHWVGFRRTLSKKNYGIVAIFSKDGRARLYKADLDKFFFEHDGRTYMLRHDCVFRGKDDIPMIEFDLECKEPLKRFIYVLTDVPRFKPGSDGKPVPVFEEFPQWKTNDLGQVLFDEQTKKPIPLLDDKGKQVVKYGKQIVDRVQVPYREVDVNPIVNNTDQHLWMDWAMSLFTSEVGKIVLFCVIIIVLVLLFGGGNAYLGVSNGGKLDALSGQVAECLKNFAVSNMTNTTGRIAVLT